MNSTTSPDAYVPFWIVQDFLDCAPPEPFVAVRVLAEGERHLIGPGGKTLMKVCDIELKPGLVATGIPLEYLIAPAELGDWARKIADWFLEHPAKILQGANDEAQPDTP